MYCKNCGAPLNENQDTCLQCGVKAGAGDTHCANCGQPIDPKAVACVHCGCATNNPGAAQAPAGEYLAGKDKTTMALICFFLGALGVHNFMMGETKKGVLRLVLTLCTGGIGGIFALIDFIKILTDKYVVDPNALI